MQALKFMQNIFKCQMEDRLVVCFFTVTVKSVLLDGREVWTLTK